MSQPEQREPSDFAPTASWKNLRLRGELLKRLRNFFDDRGFLEVETPLLSADVVVDRYLDPLPVDVPGTKDRMWLQTSPEAGMKRLLASGGEAIYQVTRAFRSGERGRLHNVEFTIAEWYRVGDDYQQAMQLLAELAEELLQLGAVERLSYRDAFEQHVGLNPFAAETAEFAEAAKQHNIAVPNGIGDDRDDWLNLLLAECVEPHLGSPQPTILYDYPATQAALARVRDDEVPVAERFELYVKGIELANGYHELLDADELRRRNTKANAQRAAEGKQTLPEESRLLHAMQSGLPPCSGVALGFDRLVMIAAGAESLAEVMPFTIDRA